MFGINGVTLVLPLSEEKAAELEAMKQKVVAEREAYFAHWNEYEKQLWKEMGKDEPEKYRDVAFVRSSNHGYLVYG